MSAPYRCHEDCRGRKISEILFRDNAWSVDFFRVWKTKLVGREEAMPSNTTRMLTPSSVHIAATANNSIILNS